MTCRQRRSRSPAHCGGTLRGQAGYLSAGGSPALPGRPLAPRGGAGPGQPSRQHPPLPRRDKATGGRERAAPGATATPAPRGFDQRRRRSRGAARAPRTRDTAAAASGLRCHRAPPDPRRHRCHGARARPQRGDTPPEQPDPVPAAPPRLEVREPVTLPAPVSAGQGQDSSRPPGSLSTGTVAVPTRAGPGMPQPAPGTRRDCRTGGCCCGSGSPRVLPPGDGALRGHGRAGG